MKFLVSFRPLARVYRRVFRFAASEAGRVVAKLPVTSHPRARVIFRSRVDQKLTKTRAPGWYSYVDPDAPDFVQYGLEECQNAGHRKDRLKCPLDRDRFDETRSMVVDLGVLAKADAFVGSLWSNVGRLSYELSAADKGCLPPLISRDVGWCSVDGQLQDGTVYGHLNC